MTEIPTVRPGQVWADNDKRSEGRKVRVIRVEGEFAFVQPAAGRRGAPGSGRITRIRLGRFRPTSTGYRLVEDAKPPCVICGKKSTTADGIIGAHLCDDNDCMTAAYDKAYAARVQP